MSQMDAYQVASYITRYAGIIRNLQESKTAENISALENIDELLSSIYEYAEQKKEEGEEKKTTTK